MEGKAKFLGHSIHPILIVFPLGLLATAVIFDAIFLIWGNTVFATVAYWLLTAGLVGALVAAPFGWFDWFGIPGGTRAKRIGLAHGLANMAAVVLFALSWYFRIDNQLHPPIVASVFSFAGAALAAVGGWLGGELVERLGIGVHEGANPDAPSSLANDPPLAGAHPRRT